MTCFLFPLFFVVYIAGCGQNYLKNGLKYLNESSYDKAEIEFRRAIAKKPHDVKGYVNLGITYIRQGKLSEAIPVFESAVEIDKSSADAYNNLAFAYAEKNIKLDSALYLAKNAILLRPTDPKILDTLAWIYYKKGVYYEAMATISEATSTDPNNRLFQEHLKAIAQKEKRLKEAWIHLGNQNIEQGMKLLEIEGDGKTASSSIEGVECRKTEVKNLQNSFYFSLYATPTKKIEELRVEVEYSSQNANPISLYLLLNDKSFQVNQVSINKINKVDENWREASFNLTQTPFSFTTFNQSDQLDQPDQPEFKLVNASSDEDICVRSVYVSWIEEE